MSSQTPRGLIRAVSGEQTPTFVVASGLGGDGASTIDDDEFFATDKSLKARTATRSREADDDKVDELDGAPRQQQDDLPKRGLGSASARSPKRARQDHSPLPTTPKEEAGEEAASEEEEEEEDPFAGMVTNLARFGRSTVRRQAGAA